MSILNKNKSYTFSDYFALNYSTEEIIAELGYNYKVTQMPLPRGDVKHSLAQLRAMFYKKLPYIALTSETAKREVMIAPILLELLDEIEVKIDIEYPIYVNKYLKGNLDYWLRSTQELLVIEAKKADLERGFTQLAVELIAIDQFIENTHENLYGAITIGNIWQFGKLHRETKQVIKDIDAFRVPLDLESLFQVLIGILK